MADFIELFAGAAEVFDGLVVQLKEVDWQNPTPDDDWSVRDLVNHVAVEDLWVPEMMNGKTVAEVGNKFDGDQLGGSPKEVWSKASADALEAFKAHPNGVAHLSFGDTPGQAYAAQMFMDHLIHAWDLAKGANLDYNPNQELIEAAFEEMSKQAEDWRSGGAFKAKVEVNDEASTEDKLLALTGRDPKWSAK